MHILIALGGIAVGAVLSIVGLPFLGAPILMVGAILFTCYFDTVSLVDYITQEDGLYVATTRHCRYAVPLIFFGLVRILYRVDYLRMETKPEDLQNNTIPDEGVHILTAKEYRALVALQRQQYLDGTVPAELVTMVCDPQEVNYARKKRLYVIDWVLLALCATMFTVPAAILFAVGYCALTGWLVYLRGKEYKEAKVKHQVYSHYFPQP